MASGTSVGICSSLLGTVAIEEVSMNYFEDDNGDRYQLQRCPFCGKSVAMVLPESELKLEKKDVEMFTVAALTTMVDVVPPVGIT